MISLWILVASFVISLFLTACGLAVATRLLGSPRAGFANCVIATLLVQMVGIFCLIVAAVLKAIGAFPVLIAITTLAAIFPIFFILKWRFSASTKKSFAYLGAYCLCSVLLVVFAKFVMKPHVVEAFVATTVSMNPTIIPGDRFTVNKLIGPHRWDIIAFHPPVEPQETYCKRLVGLPGERLRFDGGSVYVNDQALVAPAVVAGKYYASPFGPTAHNGRYDEGDTISLGPDEYFVIGDNVSRSADSRTWGPLKMSATEGVIDLKYWPPNRLAFFR
jgi:signal peptidase I